MNTMIFASPLTLRMYLSIWQQNSGPRDSHCSFNITLYAALGLLKAASFTYHMEYTSFAMSKEPELLTFAHQVMTYFMNRFTDCDYIERQHSAKLKMRLSGLIRAAFFFFKSKNAFQLRFVVLCKFLCLRNKM